MSKIDVSQWKEFKIGQIIQFKSSKHVYHASKLDIQKKPESSEWYPYVVRSAFNNGIRGYVNLDKKDLNPANTISFAQDTAQFFFQTQPYYTGNKVKICSLKDDNVPLTISKALFLISCMYKSFESFSYETSYTVPRLKRVQIKLPVDSSGNPDWQYMDSYITKRAVLAHKYVSELKSTKNQRKPLKINGWKEFKLTELFTVSSGTKFDKRRVILTPEPHNINFIGRTGSLNGINAKCGIYKNTEPFPAGLITVALGGTIGACFVQDKPFYTSQNVDVLIPLKCYVPKMTWNVKQFIASCIFRESQNNYLTFVRELNKHIKRDFVIKLPVTSSGQPDWQYMDSYIADLAALSHHQLQAFKQVVH